MRFTKCAIFAAFVLVATKNAAAITTQRNKNNLRSSTSSNNMQKHVHDDVVDEVANENNKNVYSHTDGNLASEMMGDVMDEFLESHTLKKGASYKLIRVTENDDSFVIGGNTVSMNRNDLDNVFVRSDQTRRSERIYRGRMQNSLSSDIVSIQADANGRLERATKFRKGRRDNDQESAPIVVLERLEGDWFIEYSMDDIDQERLSQFVLDHMPTGSDNDNNKNNRGLAAITEQEQEFENDIFNMVTEAQIYRNDDHTSTRALQTEECSDVTIVRIAIKYDSGFCALAGGTKAQAEARIEEVIADINAFYEVSDLCKRLTLCDVEGFCGYDIIEDSYHNLLTGSNQVCNNNNGALENFIDTVYAGGFPGLFDAGQCDLTHLLYGNDSEGANPVSNSGFVIGCAASPALCNNDAAGVNHFGFTSNVVLQSVLLAHEVAHNLGAAHDTSNGFIMQPSICSCDEFSNGSKSSMNSYIAARASNTCTVSGGGSGGGGGGDDTPPQEDDPEDETPPEDDNDDCEGLSRRSCRDTAGCSWSGRRRNGFCRANRT